MQVKSRNAGKLKLRDESLDCDFNDIGVIRM